MGGIAVANDVCIPCEGTRQSVAAAATDRVANVVIAEGYVARPTRTDRIRRVVAK